MDEGNPNNSVEGSPPKQGGAWSPENSKTTFSKAPLPPLNPISSLPEDLESRNPDNALSPVSNSLASSLELNKKEISKLPSMPRLDPLPAPWTSTSPPQSEPGTAPPALNVPVYALPAAQSSKVSFQLPSTVKSGGSHLFPNIPPVHEADVAGNDQALPATSSTQNLHYHAKTASSHASGAEGRIITDMDLLDQLRLRIAVQHATGMQHLTVRDLQPLRKKSRLLGDDVDGDDGRVKHVRSETLRRGCFFIPADTMDSLMKSAKESVTVYVDYESQLSASDPAAGIQVRPFILFPSSMRVPLWLARDFTKQREWSVICDWDLDLPSRMVLMLTRKLEVARKQYYTVWQGKQTYGRGSRFFLYGAEGTGEFTDYPYITVLQFSVDGSIADSYACTEDGEAALASTMASVGNPSLGRGAVLQQLSAFDESSLIQAVNSQNLDLLRSQVRAKHLRFALRKQHVVDEVEKAAYEANDPELMLDLYRATTTEMDLSVLAFLLHSAAKQPVIRPPMPNGDPNIADQVERFLINYVITRRNPLSVTAAIIMALQTERRNNFDTRRMTTLMLARFHSLHLALLKRLNRHADARGIRLIERILEPVDKPRTVNEVSPLQVAFESSDLDFMSETLVSLYTLLKWQGLEFTSISNSSNPRSVSPLSSLIGYVVLEKLGFAGGFLDPALMYASRLWHTLFMTSYNFFNSPRGRWVQHALCEGCFVAIYEMVSMYPTMRYIREVEIVFLTFVIGNLADIFLYVYYRYGDLGSLNKFARDPWNALSLWLNMALLGLGSAILARQEWDTPKFLIQLQELQDASALVGEANAPGDPVRMALSALAIFVWARCLGLAVPLYTSLGPLLNTVAQMVEELMAFVFPLLVVLIAFATTMTAVFHEQMQLYENFWQSLLSMFSAMLGNFDFTTFTANSSDLIDGAQSLTYGQTVYGIVILVVFLVISAILLMNLLIAIITYRYRPEEVESESQFKQSLIMDYYRVQVEYHLACSPFSLAQLALQVIQYPGGQRQKPNAVESADFGLPPIDGAMLPEDSSGRATGRSEFPHFVFLCTVYPIMAISTNIAFVAYTPFACMQYVLKQNKRFSKWYQKWRQHKRDKEDAKKEEQKEAYKRLLKKTKSSGSPDGGDVLYMSPEAPQSAEAGAPNNQLYVVADGKAAPGSAPADSSSAFQAYSAMAFDATADRGEGNGDAPGGSNNTNNNIVNAYSTDISVLDGGKGDGDKDSRLTREMSSALGSSSIKGGPGPAKTDKFKKFKKKFDLKAGDDGEEGMDMSETVLLFGLASLTWIVGLAMYLTIGFVVVFLWGTLYMWLAKLLWSAYNLTIYQFIFSFRSYQKDVEARRQRDEIEERRRNLLRSDSGSSSIDSLDDVVDAFSSCMGRFKAIFCCCFGGQGSKSGGKAARGPRRGGGSAAGGVKKSGGSSNKRNSVSPEGNKADGMSQKAAVGPLDGATNNGFGGGEGHVLGMPLTSPSEVVGMVGGDVARDQTEIDVAAKGGNRGGKPGFMASVPYLNNAPAQSNPGDAAKTAYNAGVVDVESGPFVLSVLPSTPTAEKGPQRGAVGGSDGKRGGDGGEGGGGEGGDIEEVPLGEEVEDEEEPPKKTQARWLLGLELVTSMLRQRYMSESDVIKAVSRSKFAVNMKEWGIRVKAAGKQDMVEDQLNDLEDNDEDDDGDEDNLTRIMMSDQRDMRERIDESFVQLKDRGERRDAEISLLRDEMHLAQTHIRDLTHVLTQFIGNNRRGGASDRTSQSDGHGGLAPGGHGILHHDSGGSNALGAENSNSGIVGHNQGINALDGGHSASSFSGRNNNKFR